MLKFDMINGVAVIDATTLLLIPELKAVYDAYQPPIRDKVLTYIHVRSRLDPKAPFFTAQETELHELAVRNWFDEDFPFPSSEEEVVRIEKGVTAYKKAFETAEVRILKLFDDKIDQIKQTIQDTKPKIEENTNPTTGSVTFSSNIDIITKAMEKIDSLIVAKERLEAKIRNESEGKGSIRGGKKPSRLERKSIQNS